MTVRARIVIKGDVQEAGYRSFIMRAAQKLKLKGYVENLPDGSVRIVCEGNRKAIDEFSKEIRLENDMVHVESLRRYFSKPRGEFKRFEVKTSDLAYEMFQGYATAGKHFKMPGQKVDGVGEKVDNLTVHTDLNFNKLDDKYGLVSEMLVSMNSEQRKTREELTRTVDNLNSLVNSVNILIQEHIEKEKEKKR